MTAMDTNIMQMSPDQLFETPEIYFERFDFQTDMVTCHKMSRDDYARSSFLDSRLETGGQSFNLNTHSLFEACKIARHKARRVNFIFHIAFGGSTLISRCLDKPNICLSYKEPFMLHQISFLARDKWKITTKDQPQKDFNTQWAGLSLDLLARTYHRDEIAMIKPSDSCNNLIAPLLKSRPDSKAILLYTDLESFALSMLKHKERRDYMRKSLPRAQTDFETMGYKGLTYAGLTDGEAVAYLWFSQLIHFYRVLQHDELAVKSLSTPQFFKNPVETLSAISEYFGMAHTAADFHRHVESGAFTKDSKRQDNNYDAQITLKTKQAKLAKLKPEIDTAKAWVEQMSKIIYLPANLPRSII